MPSRAKFRQALLELAKRADEFPDGVLRFEVPLRTFKLQPGDVVTGDWRASVEEAGVSVQGMTGEDALEALMFSLPPKA